MGGARSRVRRLRMYRPVLALLSVPTTRLAKITLPPSAVSSGLETRSSAIMSRTSRPRVAASEGIAVSRHNGSRA